MPPLPPGEFLPNAFYIVIYFVHFRDIREMPVAFDAAMIGSFALAGLLLGFASLQRLQLLVRGLGEAQTRFVTVGALCLSAVGIYLGRVQGFQRLATPPADLDRARRRWHDRLTAERFRASVELAGDAHMGR